MMQQPAMTQQDIDAALAQLDAQEDVLERMQQGQQAMGPAPWPYSPFQGQAMMQQRSPLGSNLLVGALVMAGLYLLNKSYKFDIRKRSDDVDQLDKLLNTETAKL